MSATSAASAWLLAAPGPAGTAAGLVSVFGAADSGGLSAAHAGFAAVHGPGPA